MLKVEICPGRFCKLSQFPVTKISRWKVCFYFKHTRQRATYLILGMATIGPVAQMRKSGNWSLFLLNSDKHMWLVERFDAKEKDVSIKKWLTDFVSGNRYDIIPERGGLFSCSVQVVSGE